MADVSPTLLTDTVDEFIELLQPGDVILYDTRSPIGGLVQWVDRAPVNHASIMLDQTQTLEAYLPDKPQERHVVLTSMREMLGFDFHSAIALRHVDVAREPALADGIVENIKRYLTRNDKFTTVDLILLGPAALRRSGYAADPHLPRLPMQLVMVALNAFFRAALRKVPEGPEQVFCSELVFRCLVEEATGLEVRILEPITQQLVTPGDDEVGPWGEATISEELVCWEELRAKVTAPVADMSDVVGGVRADFVTPGDLWRSPDLQPVAHYLWPPRKKAPAEAMMIGDQAVRYH